MGISNIGCTLRSLDVPKVPIYLPSVDQRRLGFYEVAYHLARRSVPAAFWFVAFALTHDYHQNFEIMDSGLAQVVLGYTGSMTKG